MSASVNAITDATWFAKPVPSNSIGVPPVSGPAGSPDVGPAVAARPRRSGSPAYVAFEGSGLARRPS